MLIAVNYTKNRFIPMTSGVVLYNFFPEYFTSALSAYFQVILTPVSPLVA